MSNSSEFLLRTSREYGLYTLDKRAIPAMTDGLKSGQRIALWLLRNQSEKVKTIALAGRMIASELYVHGDTAAADAISMLAGPYCNNRPLIKGVGAFGTRANPTSFAAPRYTSVKRSDLARNALYVDLDIVPMVENHDGSAWMPRTFLPLIPLVLLNGIKGIATGWATNILPRRFEDLIGAVDDVLNKQPVRLLLPHYENRNVKVVPDASGNGKYIISGMVEQKNTTTIIVTELPPELPLEKFREQLSVLEEDGKIIGFTDRSTKTINVEIKMPRAILAKLETNGRIIEFLKLRSIVTENITVIVNGKVIQYSSAEELVKDWVDWRLQLYLDRFEKLVADEELTNLYWLYILACFEDELIPLIPSMSGKNELKDAILNAGHEQNGLPKASDDMLDKIANIPAYKWTKAGLDDAETQFIESDKRLSHYKTMVSSDTKRKNLFKKEVEALI